MSLFVLNRAELFFSFLLSYCSLRISQRCAYRIYDISYMCVYECVYFKINCKSLAQAAGLNTSSRLTLKNERQNPEEHTSRNRSLKPHATAP